MCQRVRKPPVKEKGSCDITNVEIFVKTYSGYRLERRSYIGKDLLSILMAKVLKKKKKKKKHVL